MQVDLSFTEPRFLDRNLSAGFDLFHKEIDQTSQSGFNSRRTGGTLRLGFPLSEKLWLQTSYTLSRDEIYRRRRTIANVTALVVAAPPSGSVATPRSVGTSLTYDKRNHPKNPTSGYYLQAGADFAGLGGDVQYVRFAGEARGYYPITEKITFVGRVIGGHIQGWGGEDVRLHRPVLQGRRDHPRLRPRRLRSARLDDTDDALGGSHLLGDHGRGPLPAPVRAGRSRHQRRRLRRCRLAVRRQRSAQELLDGMQRSGDRRSNVCLDDSSTIRSSVGASIMWNSPVGPLRMDFARSLTKENYDKEQFFRFGASTKF